MIKKLKAIHYQAIARELFHWYSFRPTNLQLKTFLVGESKVKHEIKTQPYLLEAGLDTFVREMLTDVFSRKLVGRSWPTVDCKKIAKKRFFIDFCKAAEKANIKCDKTMLS